MTKPIFELLNLVFHLVLELCVRTCYIVICVKRRKEPTAEEKENILLVLTNDGYLKVMSADTGSVLRSIFLSTIIKFRYTCTHIISTFVFFC